MSLYCKGEYCKRYLGCMRFTHWELFWQKYHQENADGLYFVNEKECVKNNYKYRV